MLFNSPSLYLIEQKKSFIINLWFIMGLKHAGNKVWHYANKKLVATRNKTWFLNHVHSLWVTSCYGTLLFDLQLCILFISILFFLINVDTLITLYFYVCMEQGQEEENNQRNQQNIPLNNSSHGSSSIIDNSYNKEW